jgi:probable phosphoglycerate mutase
MIELTFIRHGETGWNLQQRFQGQSDVPTIPANHPDLWAQWLEHRADFALAGGQSLRQFHARVMAALQELAEAQRGRHVTVAAHGGVLDVLWCSAKGIPLDGLRNCAIPNTGINRQRWREGRLEILGWADDAHRAP